jgi:hypothetical protein
MDQSLPTLFLAEKRTINKCIDYNLLSSVCTHSKDQASTIHPTGWLQHGTASHRLSSKPPQSTPSRTGWTSTGSPSPPSITKPVTIRDLVPPCALKYQVAKLKSDKQDQEGSSSSYMYIPVSGLEFSRVRNTKKPGCAVCPVWSLTGWTRF